MLPIWISDAQLLAGQRFIKLAKSPISPPLAFRFNITSSGIVLLDDNGIEMKGPAINNIHCQGLFLSFSVVRSAECILNEYTNYLEKINHSICRVTFTTSCYLSISDMKFTYKKFLFWFKFCVKYDKYRV